MIGSFSFVPLFRLNLFIVNFWFTISHVITLLSVEIETLWCTMFSLWFFEKKPSSYEKFSVFCRSREMSLCEWSRKWKCELLLFDTCLSLCWSLLLQFSLKIQMERNEHLKMMKTFHRYCSQCYGRHGEESVCREKGEIWRIVSSNQRFFKQSWSKEEN